MGYPPGSAPEPDLVRDLAKGQMITAEDLGTARQGGGTSPMLAWDLIGTLAGQECKLEIRCEQFATGGGVAGGWRPCACSARRVAPAWPSGSLVCVPRNCRLAASGRGFPRWATTPRLEALDPAEIWLVNGIGSIPGSMARWRVQEGCSARGYRWLALDHPSSVRAADVSLAEGVQLMAGAVIQPGCRLDAGVVVNTRATVEHDCQLDEHVFVGPGAVLCGDVKAGRGVFIGAGAIVFAGHPSGRGCNNRGWCNCHTLSRSRIHGRGKSGPNH